VGWFSTGVLGTKRNMEIYRGQRQNWKLASTLERALENWNIDLQNGPSIERELIREFRRRFRGDYQTRVDSDTLYCLAVMQHHGAPVSALATIDASVALRTLSGSRRSSSPFNSIRSKA